MMIFRYVADERNMNPSEEETQKIMQQWQSWIGGIAGQGKLESTEALGYTGKSVDGKHVVTDGPYAEVKEIVGGYLTVKCETEAEALEHAKGCPILHETGGKVEVREIMVF